MDLTLSTVTLNAADPPALARFYRDLLGWPITSEDPTWVTLGNPAGGVGLAVALEPLQAAPVWPARPGAQQMQLHLEIRVDELDSAVEHALACGATLAESQPQPDVRVCLDPAGHPFCLWIAT